MNGLHGMLAPDMDEDEIRTLSTIMRALNLAVVKLVDARADDDSLERGIRLADVVYLRLADVVYLKAAPGRTGTPAEIEGDLQAVIDSSIRRIRALQPHLPIAVGIGIQRPDQVAALAALGVDMVVIGTRLVERVTEDEGALVAYLQTLRAATPYPNSIHSN